MLAPMRYNDSGERASQMIPDVKCSTCGAPVPLSALGDHVCAPPSPGPARPRFQGSAANSNSSRAPSPLRRDFNDGPMQPPPPRREFNSSPGPRPFNANDNRGRGGFDEPDGGRGPFYPPPREHSASPARHFRGPENMPLPPSPSSHHFPARRELSQSPALQSPRPRAAVPPGGPAGSLLSAQQQQQQRPPVDRSFSSSPMPDTTSGGSAGMAGVGRRGYMAESTLMHPPPQMLQGTPQPPAQAQGRRANAPQQLALDPRPGRA